LAEAINRLRSFMEKKETRIRKKIRCQRSPKIMAEGLIAGWFAGKSPVGGKWLPA
jgi:hypothetical protein